MVTIYMKRDGKSIRYSFTKPKEPGFKEVNLEVNTDDRGLKYLSVNGDA